jgi:hypothetical protein
MKKKPEKVVKKAVDELLLKIEQHKDEAKQEGLTFVSLSKAELLKKERGEASKSPYAYAFSWATPVVRGGTGLYRMHIRNPDSYSHLWLFMTIFFGLGFIFDDLGQAWIGRDKRWPELSTAQFNMAPNSYAVKIISFDIPSNIQVSTYLGNSVFWKQIFPHGEVYYRGGFDITVSS